MGTTAQKLQKVLESKNAIKAAIQAKGVVGVGDKMSEYATLISTIQGGGSGEASGVVIDLGALGYDSVPLGIVQMMNRSAQILAENQPIRSRSHSGENILFYPKTSAKAETMDGAFTSSSLIYLPLIDTSEVIQFTGAFQKSAIHYIERIDTSSGTAFNNMFFGCAFLKEIPAFDLSNAKTVAGMFSDCRELKKIPALNTVKVTDFGQFLQNCMAVNRIEGLSFKSVSREQNLASSGLPNIRYMLIKDIGTVLNCSQLDFRFQNWGQTDEENPDARQSVVDTLITYSFDRASANYSTCNIRLHSATKELLTSKEKEQITAKGYALT